MCIRSLSLEDVDAYENPVPLFALLRKVYDRQADVDGVRSGSYFMDVQLLVRVGNADFNDHKRFRLTVDDSMAAPIIRFAFEDIFGSTFEYLRSCPRQFDGYNFMKNCYYDGYNCFFHTTYRRKITNCSCQYASRIYSSSIIAYFYVC